MKSFHRVCALRGRSISAHRNNAFEPRLKTKLVVVSSSETKLSKRRVLEIVDQTQTAVSDFANFAEPYAIDAATIRSIRRICNENLSKA